MPKRKNTDNLNKCLVKISKIYPLHNAIVQSNYDAVAKYIKNGQRLDEKNEDGKTALDLAWHIPDNSSMSWNQFENLLKELFESRGQVEALKEAKNAINLPDDEEYLVEIIESGSGYR